MPGIFELLPLLVDEYTQPVGWKATTEWRLNISLSPGHSNGIKFDNPGYIVSVAGVFDSPFVSLQHNVWGKPVSFTPYDLMLIAQISPTGPAGLTWLQQYDLVHSLFHVKYEPKPEQYFLPKTNIWLTAPNRDQITGLPITTDTLIRGVSWYIIEITNIKQFNDKLKEVLTGKLGRTSREIEVGA